MELTKAYEIGGLELVLVIALFIMAFYLVKAFTRLTEKVTEVVVENTKAMSEMKSALVSIGDKVDDTNVLCTQIKDNQLRRSHQDS